MKIAIDVLVPVIKNAVASLSGDDGDFSGRGYALLFPYEAEKRYARTRTYRVNGAE